jgi:hypothetical protein
MCVAVTVEVAFNGLRSFVTRNYDQPAQQKAGTRQRDYNLPAETSLWMLPVYFFGLGFGLEGLLGLMVGQSRWLIVPILGLSIIVFEYVVAGAFSLFGHEPWRYTRGWHIHGWTRLDYFPYWCVFALGFLYAHGVITRWLT